MLYVIAGHLNKTNYVKHVLFCVYFKCADSAIYITHSHNTEETHNTKETFLYYGVATHLIVAVKQNERYI